MNFDEKNPLVMNARRAVLGHPLNRGTVLKVVDEPEAPGEVDEQTANLLFAKKLALPSGDFRPTAEAPKTEEPDLSPSQRRKVKKAPKVSEPSPTPTSTPKSTGTGPIDTQDDKPD